MTTRKLILASALAAILPSAAAAADPSGVYVRDTGGSKVRIARCGANFCGTLVWLEESGGPAKVGQRIFYDMSPTGENEWRGSAFNPEDGRTYSGRMSLKGTVLTTAGCVAGGLICRSVLWNKE